jgi:ribosomal protein S27AE
VISYDDQGRPREPLEESGLYRSPGCATLADEPKERLYELPPDLYAVVEEAYAEAAEILGRRCEACGRSFIAKRSDARHCSDVCRVTAWKRRQRSQRRPA